eukprot:156649-Chlamydomonas_euryale.AAC.1
MSDKSNGGKAPRKPRRSPAKARPKPSQSPAKAPPKPCQSPAKASSMLSSLSEPQFPLTTLRSGPLDYWTTEPLDRWTAGPLNHWTTGPLDHWTTGPLDHWTTGPLDHWTTGPLDNTFPASPSPPVQMAIRQRTVSPPLCRRRCRSPSQAETPHLASTGAAPRCWPCWPLCTPACGGTRRRRSRGRGLRCGACKGALRVEA